jgi:hypothetical protein
MPSPLALALMQGQQQSTPQQPFRATVQPTDVEKAYSDYNNSMMQAYSAQLGQQNAMWGGLAGLGAAGVTTLPKLLGGTGTAAAGAGGDVALSGIPDALASGIAPEDLLASLLLV